MNCLIWKIFYHSIPANTRRSMPGWGANINADIQISADKIPFLSDLSELNKCGVLLPVIKKMHTHVLLLVAVYLYVFYFLPRTCSFKFDMVDRFAISVMNLESLPGFGQARLKT